MDLEEWYCIQDFYTEERLDRIREWMECEIIIFPDPMFSYKPA